MGDHIFSKCISMKVNVIVLTGIKSPLLVAVHIIETFLVKIRTP